MSYSSENRFLVKVFANKFHSFSQDDMWIYSRLFNKSWVKVGYLTVTSTSKVDFQQSRTLNPSLWLFTNYVEHFRYLSILIFRRQPTVKVPECVRFWHENCTPLMHWPYWGKISFFFTFLCKILPGKKSDSLATLDKILWEAVKSGVACIGCKCGQCLNSRFRKFCCSWNCKIGGKKPELNHSIYSALNFNWNKPDQPV